MSHLPHAPGAVLSLVCGILAVLLCLFPIVGLLLAVTSLVAAFVSFRAARRHPDRYRPPSLAIAGLTCGLIAGAVTSLVTGVMLLIILGHGSASFRFDPHGPPPPHPRDDDHPMMLAPAWRP